MLNRMQVTALVFAGLFGLCAMIGLVYFLAYLVETKQFEWAEFWATVAVIALVFIWLFAPGKLDEERQEAQRLKEDQSYRDHVARIREAHMNHLKFMEAKQSKSNIDLQNLNSKQREAVKTYNFINDLN